MTNSFGDCTLPSIDLTSMILAMVTIGCGSSRNRSSFLNLSDETANETVLSLNAVFSFPSALTISDFTKEYAKTHTLKETHDKVVNDINSVDGLDVEYFSIVDGNTLQDVQTWDDSSYIVGCITVYCGKTPIRLIDHIKYKS